MRRFTLLATARPIYPTHPNAVTIPNDLRHLFGNIDIYLFDKM